MQEKHTGKFDKGALFFLAPALIFLFFVVIFPLFKVFQFSFQEYSSQSLSFVFVGLKHYKRLFFDHLFWVSIRTTSIFTISSVILHVVFAYLLALLLNAKWHNLKLRNFFRGASIFPYLFSAPAAALLWGVLFLPLGYLNYSMNKLFNITVSFLGDPKIALFSIVFVNGWRAFPVYMILILGGLQSIPEYTYEAALVDGANRFQTLWYVTLPQMFTITMTVILIDFATTFIHFDLVWTMTRGGPSDSTYLSSFFLYQMGIQQCRFGYGSAIGVIIALVMFAFIGTYIFLFSKEQEI